MQSVICFFSYDSLNVDLKFTRSHILPPGFYTAISFVYLKPDTTIILFFKLPLIYDIVKETVMSLRLWGLIKE